MVIVSPARAEANNGNWRTAERWARHLSEHCRTRIVTAWQPGLAADALIALHARRSAGSVLLHAKHHPQVPRVVVLTGTDIYRDLHTDPSAQQALQAATRLVALQEDALAQLPAAWRGRSVVIHQSVEPGHGGGPPASPTGQELRVIQVAHLRGEKDPLTYLRAVERLASQPGIAFELVGAALEPELGAAAEAVARRCPRLRWHGALAHEAARERIAQAHVLVNTSRIEGGAHVLIEAIVCQVAVLASRVGGNLGMLGADHPGYFDVGDDAALGALLRRCRDDAAFLESLRQHAGRRAPLFAPARERQALLALLRALGTLPPTGGLWDD